MGFASSANKSIDTHTHTQMSNTYCFSTARMVSRTRLTVTLYLAFSNIGPDGPVDALCTASIYDSLTTDRNIECFITVPNTSLYSASVILFSGVEIVAANVTSLGITKSFVHHLAKRLHVIQNVPHKIGPLI